MDGFLKTHLFFDKRINGTEKVGGGWTTEMTWGGDGWFTEEVGEQGVSWQCWSGVGVLVHRRKGENGGRDGDGG